MVDLDEPVLLLPLETWTREELIDNLRTTNELMQSLTRCLQDYVFTLQKHGLAVEYMPEEMRATHETVMETAKLS